MNFNKERKGELIVFLNAIIWGFFPIFIIQAFQTVGPHVVLAWNSFFAMIFFAFLITFQKRWYQVFDRAVWKDMLYVALFLGILLYAFYYSGLQYTNAGNASLIAQTEIFFSYLFFHVWQKDTLSRLHALGAMLMVIGAAIVLLPNYQELRIGDFLILVAMACAPAGNYFSMHARKKVSSEAVLFVRLFVSTPFLFFLAFLFGQMTLSGTVMSSLPYLAILGILFFGIEKILWLEGIHRISVTKANAISCITPPITLFAVWVLHNQVPTTFQLTSIFPLAAGLILLSINGRQKRENGIIIQSQS